MSATENVYWLLVCDVKNGKLGELKSLLDQMEEDTKANEPGALAYEFWVSDDESTAHLYERYADSDATLTHLEGFGKNYAERFMGVVTPKKFLVYGNADERVQKALSGMGAVFHKSLGGFTR